MTPAPPNQPSSVELHLLYVLLDSNLPTGGFVSSSGLESYAKHGFLSTTPSTYDSIKTTLGGVGEKRSIAQGIIEFSKFEIENYSMTTSCFVSDSWKIVNEAFEWNARKQSKWKGKGKDGAEVEGVALEEEEEQEQDKLVEKTVNQIISLDKYNETTLLSHVVRRSSKAQGVAMLTLYTRGLSEPSGISEMDGIEGNVEGEEGVEEGEELKLDIEMSKKVIDLYKKQIRKNQSPGHLAICWGVITRCLGLSLDRAIHLHLFLHARSLLSSAVRLNLIGPYASSQLLLHPFKKIIDDQVMKFDKNGISSGFVDLTSDCVDSDLNLDSCQIDDQISSNQTLKYEENDGEQDEEDKFWSWTIKSELKGPNTTWPLGELLSSRHDLQHSRIFNS